MSVNKRLIPKPLAKQFLRLMERERKNKAFNRVRQLTMSFPITKN